MTSNPATTGITEIQALARAGEPERYLAATLAPASQRIALMAIAAYAAELARIAVTVTEPVLGEIRLQWWRDSLTSLATTSDVERPRIGSPVADALGTAMATHDVPLPMLLAMSEARAWDLYDDPMPDQPALDGYLAKTEAIPFELALRVLGVPPGDAGALSRPAGQVFGMTRLLTRLASPLSKGRLPLPAGLLDAYGLDADQLLHGVNSGALRPLIVALSEDITRQLASLTPQVAALSRSQRLALLPLATVGPYLKAVNRRRHNPARDIAELAPLTRVWRIGLAHWQGRI